MSAERTDAPFITAGVLIVAAAIATRVYAFGGDLLPINDGALFLSFVEHIHAGKYFSDPCVTYNGDCIPLAYPPLSFFAASFFLDVGLSPINVAASYPLLISMLLIVATIVLVLKVSIDPTVRILALAGMLLQERSLEYVLMGGGISRATGALFFVIALIATFRLIKSRSTLGLLACGISIGASMLSHPEWGLNAAIGMTILVLTLGASSVWSRMITIVCVGVIAFVLILPWLLWILETHGSAPFESASATAEWSAWSLLGILNLNFLPVGLSLFCAVGAVVLVWRGQLTWILMLLAFYVITPRHFDSVAVFPNAVLAAYGVMAMVEYATSRSAREHTRRLVKFGIALTFGVALSGALVLRIETNPSYAQVSNDVLDAALHARNTFPSEAKSLVIWPTRWHISYAGEWWPYLSGHTNLNTPQGSEWLAQGVFQKRVEIARSLIWRGDCAYWFSQAKQLGHVDYAIDLVGSGCFDKAALEFQSPTLSIYRLGDALR